MFISVAMLQSDGWAINYFVSNSIGDDSRAASDARSPRTPWKTIQRAVDFAVAGDTIVVLPGNYTEHVQFRKSGTADKPITLLSRQYGRARVLGSVGGIGVAHIIVSGMSVSNSVLDPAHPPTSFDPKGIYFYYAHHILVRSNIVRDCRGGGIGLVNTDEVMVCDNVVHNNAAGFDGSHSGISIYQPLNYTGEQSDGPGTIVFRNLCFNNRNSVYLDANGNPKEITDGHGIIVDDTSSTQRVNFQIDLDYFWAVAPHAPSMPIDWQSPYTRSILIDSNVCHSNGGAGVSLYLCDRVAVRNNTCILNQRNMFDCAEINFGGSRNILAQNNLMISPLRVTATPRNRGNTNQVIDNRQAAKHSDHYVVNDAATIFWVSNALYDSPTIAGGLSSLHDANSIVLQAPSALNVNPVTGAFTINIDEQVRDRGTEVLAPLAGDFRLAPRIQGPAIDIGAMEALDPPLIFATPEDEAAFQLQLQQQAARQSQLPRFNYR